MKNKEKQTHQNIEDSLKSIAYHLDILIQNNIERDIKYQEERKKREEERKQQEAQLALEKIQREKERKQQEAQVALEKIQQEEERKRREEERKATEIISKIKEEKWQKEMKQINKQIGEFTYSYGREAEYMFYRSLKKTRFCANIYFDRIFLHVQPRKEGREYDIVLVNGDYIALVEVKRTASIEDLHKLVEVQAKELKKDMPEYKDKKMLCVLAAYTCIDTVIEKAKELGVCMLVKDGIKVKEIKENLIFF